MVSNERRFWFFWWNMLLVKGAVGKDEVTAEETRAAVSDEIPPLKSDKDAHWMEEVD